MINNYLKIPIEICQHCLEEKIAEPFRLYVYLKLDCTGKRKITHDDLIKIRQALGYKSEKTIKNQLKTLIDRNFLGYNQNTKNYFIRGFDCIRKFYGFNRRTAVQFFYKDIKTIKAFLIGAVLANLIKAQKKRRGIKHPYYYREVQHTLRPLLFPVSSVALAKVLNISKSTASLYKQMAHDNGYVFIKKNFELIPINYKSINPIRKANPEIADRLIQIENSVFLQKPDLVSANMKFKRRKKIELYNRDIKGEKRENKKNE